MAHLSWGSSLPLLKIQVHMVDFGLLSLLGSECEGTLCDFIFHLPNRLCHMSTFIIFVLKV